MTLARHTPESGPRGRKEEKKRPFRLFGCLSELRYQRTVRQIEAADRGLEALGEKRRTFALLSGSSQASVVNADESNWGEAMAQVKTYKSCRKALKSESFSAAFCLFSQKMLKAGVVGGASILLLHAAMPDLPVAVDLVLGGIFVLGTALRTWAAVTMGNGDFLKLVSMALDEQKASLDAKRLRLIRKLHGWSANEKKE